jgi:hypothetical protein
MPCGLLRQPGEDRRDDALSLRWLIEVGDPGFPSGCTLIDAFTESRSRHHDGWSVPPVASLRRYIAIRPAPRAPDEDAAPRSVLEEHGERPRRLRGLHWRQRRCREGESSEPLVPGII